MIVIVILNGSVFPIKRLALVVTEENGRNKRNASVFPEYERIDMFNAESKWNSLLFENLYNCMQLYAICIATMYLCDEATEQSRL